MELVTTMISTEDLAWVFLAFVRSGKAEIIRPIVDALISAAEATTAESARVWMERAATMADGHVVLGYSISVIGIDIMWTWGDSHPTDVRETIGSGIRSAFSAAVGS